MPDKFIIDFDLLPSEIEINYNSKIITLGSCFSDEIGNKLTHGGFNVLVNPFGTIFHPISIANVLTFALGDRNFNTINRGDIYLDYSFSGTMYALSEQRLQANLNKLGDELMQQLKSASHLILTFGTSIGYKLKSGQFVANCHQQLASLFTKDNYSVEEMYHAMIDVIKKIKKINPSIIIQITVSPVRHIKEGVIENSRSKSHLLLLSEKLEKEHGCNYFPSYEIFIDELRDYRFSKSDLIHPNEDAVSYIWNKYKKVYFSPETQKLCGQVENYHQSLRHHFKYPESKDIEVFKSKLNIIRENLLDQIPNLLLQNPIH